MRKIFILAVIVTALFASCQKDETLEEAKSLEQLQQIGNLMNPGTSFGDRLLRRSTNSRILVMVADPKIDHLLQGSSGAFLWQNGYPVGVFAAKFRSDDGPPILFFEPLIDILSKLK